MSHSTHQWQSIEGDDVSNRLSGHRAATTNDTNEGRRGKQHLGQELTHRDGTVTLVW